MKTSLRFISLSIAVSALTGCVCQQVRLPETRTTYEVGAEPDFRFDGVETVEFRGKWVLLDGRRMIPREKINYIRADRDKPSGQK
jgi:hypothetical protein